MYMYVTEYHCFLDPRLGRTSPTRHFLVVRPGNVSRDGQVQGMA